VSRQFTTSVCDFYEESVVTQQAKHSSLEVEAVLTKHWFREYVERMQGRENFRREVLVRRHFLNLSSVFARKLEGLVRLSVTRASPDRRSNLEESQGPRPCPLEVRDRRTTAPILVGA